LGTVSDVSDAAAEIAGLEERLEAALWEDERSGDVEAALPRYQEVVAALAAIDTGEDGDLERHRQRVLAYALMREANALRQTDDVEGAAEKDRQGLEAARRSGDSVSTGRALLSMAGTAFAAGQADHGETYLEEARTEFEAGTTEDHVQGAGWAWVLTADVGNAGLIDLAPAEVVAAGDRALELLEPIENWPGVARAHAARAVAFDGMGKQEQAEEARRLAAEAEAQAG
jgi:hypothetical protein